MQLSLQLSKLQGTTTYFDGNMGRVGVKSDTVYNYLINIWQMSWRSHDLHHDQTMHPTANFISLILFKIQRFNMGIFFLTSDLMEAVRGQKHPSEAKKGMKELIY
jgi:hypothetical protein